MADDPAECARMGMNGRNWVLANASRSALATRYLTAIESLVAAWPNANPNVAKSAESARS
jgi:hypothetical protein